MYKFPRFRLDVGASSGVKRKVRVRFVTKKSGERTSLPKDELGLLFLVRKNVDVRTDIFSGVKRKNEDQRSMMIAGSGEEDFLE